MLPFLSVVSTGGGLGTIMTDYTPVSSIIEEATINTNSDFEKSDTETLIKAAKIDAYFSERSMPLAGYGLVFVTEAEKNGLDWRLLAAISVRESTGGKHACKKATHSFMGWGSCKINFSSPEEAIAIVAKNLGGNNPNTAYHYSGKDTEGILKAYNPPTIVPKYAYQVMAIMDVIENTQVETAEKGIISFEA